MRPTRMLIVIACALGLTACAGSTKYVAAPLDLRAPDVALTEACRPPARLGASPMTQRSVERNWSADRKALVECGSRHGALVRFYAERDTRLQAGPR